MVVQVSFLLELPMWDVSFDYMHVDKTVHCGCIKLNPFIIYQMFLLLTNEYLQHNKPNPSSFTQVNNWFLFSTLSLSLSLSLSLILFQAELDPDQNPFHATTDFTLFKTKTVKY